jgi:PAS domain S-box-containing protein
LGAVSLLAAGLANPSAETIVGATRYVAIAAMVTLFTLTFTSPWVRRHAGWAAVVVNSVVVGYLCAMLYATYLAADSLIACFVGVLICGMVMHRVVLVVAFMVTAAILHIITAFAVAAPVIDPMTVAVNIVLYTLFVGVMLCMQITARERRRNSESVMGAIFDQSSDALVYGYPNNGDVVRVNARAHQLFQTDDNDFISRQIRKGFLAHHSLDELDGVLGRALLDPSWGEICEFETSSGRRFWGNMALRRLDAPYEHLMMARITDMTAQIEREGGLKVDYPSDYRDCTIRVDGVDADVRCTGSTLDVIFPRAGAPGELIDAFASVREAFQISKTLRAMIG